MSDTRCEGRVEKMRYILMGVLGALLILASALGDSTISSLRPKDGSTPSILKVQGENNRSPTYQLRLDGVYQQVERPIGAFNFNESLWTGLKLSHLRLFQVPSGA
jgi:hypothetical protein